MKRSNLILLGALGGILLFSLVFQLRVHLYVRQGAANWKPVRTITQNRDVPHFSAITAEGQLTIRFEQGETPNLSIKAPDILLDSIRTEVQEEKLIISMNRKPRKKDSVIISIETTELEELILSGNTHFETIQQVFGKNLILDFKDNSSVNLKLVYNSIQQVNNSTGTIRINGEVKKIDFTQNPKEEE
ncbi:MAG: DUF2807 domain-containing protein [Bacteroidota bacterium]